MNGRRSTLAAGVLTDATNIPQLHAQTKSRLSLNPTTTRQSLGPTRSRKSMAPNAMSSLADSMASVSISQNTTKKETRKSSMGVRQSTGGYERVFFNFFRRMSLYGRPSQISSGHMGIMKESRPIREKSWQAHAIRGLISFLVSSGYNQSAVSIKSLQNPSTKDFMSIFKFLYGQLDPGFEFKRKIEEDVQYVLRALRCASFFDSDFRYPFADSISKSHLYSAGSLHAWPTLLAMLTWMVELILCCDKLESQDDILGEGPLDDVQLSERIFFDYLKKSYFVFLETGVEEDPLMDKELIKSFDLKNELVIKDIEKLKKDIETLEREWEGLTGTDSPLVRIQTEKSRLESDREHLKDAIAQSECDQQKLHDSILALGADLDILETDCSNLQEEKINLQATVDAQEISPADVDRMNSERDQLVKSLEVVGTKLDEVNKDIWEKEIGIQKKMDQLEKLVQGYNTRAYKLGILGTNLSDLAPLRNELELQIHASKPDKMVSVDLRNKAKPALVDLKSRYNQQFHKYQDEMIALQETLDSVNWTLSQKDEELRTMNTRIKGLSDRYKEEKEHIGLTLTATTEEIENYERQIQRLKIESNNVLLASQQKAQKTAVEYDTLSRQYTEQKEKLLNQVVSGLVEVFNFQEHVTSTLEELKKEGEEEAVVAEALAMEMIQQQ